MGKSTKPSYGQDLSIHHLLEIREPPPSVIALRVELAQPQHKDIYDAAIKEPTFERVLAKIGERLDILLDGEYDASELCDVLVTALKNRSLKGSGSSPHKRDSRLLNVELVERDKEVTVEVVEGDGPGTIVPEVPTAEADQTQSEEYVDIFGEEEAATSPEPKCNYWTDEERLLADICFYEEEGYDRCILACPFGKRAVQMLQ